VKNVVLPARRDAVDTLEPLLGVIERGCRIETVMGSGMALGTPPPRALAPQPHACR